MKSLIKSMVLLSLLISCFPKDNSGIETLIKSDRLEDKMRAYYLIGEEKDTNYLQFLIEDINDSRVSNHLNFKGMSMYQCKVNALKKISNLEPPNEVTYKPDSVNIIFYKDWVLQRRN